MSGDLTDWAAQQVTDWLNGVGSPTRPTPPLELRLMLMNGTGTTAGTEVVGGSYAPQTVSLPPASSTAVSASLSATSFVNMPPCTVVGAEIWDATPRRVWFKAMGPYVVPAGATFRIDAGDLADVTD